jgi:hypothetical protein
MLITFNAEGEPGSRSLNIPIRQALLRDGALKSYRNPWIFAARVAMPGSFGPDWRLDLLPQGGNSNADARLSYYQIAWSNTAPPILPRADPVLQEFATASQLRVPLRDSDCGTNFLAAWLRLIVDLGGFPAPDPWPVWIQLQIVEVYGFTGLSRGLDELYPHLHHRPEESPRQ